MSSSRTTSQSRRSIAGRHHRPRGQRTTGHRPMVYQSRNHQGMSHQGMSHQGMSHQGMSHQSLGQPSGNHQGVSHQSLGQPSVSHQSGRQRPPANRQVKWYRSNLPMGQTPRNQPPMGQNPFMMDDFDDIPVALRESNVTQKRSDSKWRWVIVGGSLAGAVGLSMGITAAFFNANVLSFNNALPFNPAQAESPDVDSVIAAMGEGPLNGDRSNSDSILTPAPGQTSSSGANPAEGTTQASSPQGTDNAVKTILGHYPFEEASQADLSDIGGGILLNSTTAAAFREMRAAAQADGIDLVPLSGFRSVALQEDLFFGIKAERGQTAKERARVSAPPGHSEHHTGYAIDIGDAQDSSTDLEESFETTATFAWLEENAPYYSFELSFPRGNEQGVNYEPWHWRYVGDQASLELFHRDR